MAPNRGPKLCRSDVPFTASPQLQRLGAFPCPTGTGRCVRCVRFKGPPPASRAVLAAAALGGAEPGPRLRRAKRAGAPRLRRQAVSVTAERSLMAGE